MRGRLIARAQLGAGLAHELQALHARHFEGDAQQFERDLAEKNWVVVVEDERGRVAGFSTLLVERLERPEGALTLVSSGDTIMAREAWNSPILSRTWIDAVLRLHALHGAGRLLWLLLVSGYRTYRFLPVFLREFYPRFDRPTPAPVLRELQTLAHRRFGACYDAQAGLVRFPRPGALRAELCEVPAERRRDPHVEFFLTANPGHARGDELVCLAELSLRNLTRAGRRMLRAGAVREPFEPAG